MPRFNAWKRLSATDGVCVRVTNIGHVISHLRYSARHHEIQEGLQETRTGCLCVSVCVCVCGFKSFTSFTQGSEGKGGDPLCGDYSTSKHVEYLCVCCMSVCMNSMCV